MNENLCFELGFTASKAVKIVIEPWGEEMELNASDKVIFRWRGPKRNTKVDSSIWRELFGYNEEELIGVESDSWLALVHPEEIDNLRQHLIQSRKGELPHFEIEHRMRDRNGALPWKGEMLVLWGRSGATVSVEVNGELIETASGVIPSF